MKTLVIKTNELIEKIENLERVYDDEVSYPFRTDLANLLRELSTDVDNKVDKCPFCEASLKEYWHKLTPMLVGSLVKMKQEIIKKGENKVHLQNDLLLSKTEYNNFQKLRFHGLIAHCKDKDGGRDSGSWLLTSRGNDFVKGELAVPSRVRTFRNTVIDHDSKNVYIRDVIGSTPYLEERENIKYTLFGDQKIDDRQEELKLIRKHNDKS
jgi:hypothetical protein